MATTPITPSDLLKKSWSPRSNSSHTSYANTDDTSSTSCKTPASSNESMTNSVNDVQSMTAEHTGRLTKYDGWHDPFESTIAAPPMEIGILSTTELAFLCATQVQIERVGHLKRGFEAYRSAINSHEDGEFSQGFLTTQNFAVTITIDHLDEVQEDLRQIHAHVTAWKKFDPSNSPVEFRYREGLAAAKSWLQKMQDILVACHCFYKTNFALCGARDKKAQL